MNSQSNEKNMDMNRTNQSTPNIRWMLVGYDLVVYAVVAIILLVLYVFIFCNRKRDSIKVLRYDQNGFILATKKLLDDMKFQWPRTPDEVKEISFQQVEWLLQGLEIEQKKAHHQVKINHKNSCF